MGLGFARVAHLLASHWYYLFMSLHIRMHVGMITNTMRHPAPINCHPEIVLGSHTEEMPEQVRHAKLRKIIPRILLALVCAYDLYAFIIRGVWKYLFLRQQFFSLTWSGATPSLLWTTFLLSYYLLQSYI